MFGPLLGVPCISCTKSGGAATSWYLSDCFRWEYKEAPEDNKPTYSLAFVNRLQMLQELEVTVFSDYTDSLLAPLVVFRQYFPTTFTETVVTW